MREYHLKDSVTQLLLHLEPEILSTREPRYACNCSRERIEQVLVALGARELEEMIREQHGAQVDCHFCNKRYSFQEEELKALLEGGDDSGGEMKQNPRVVSFNRSPAYVHHRAMVNRRENNSVDALELMRHAVERSPENREYRLDLAELYCEMGCHAQSNRLLLDMLAQDDAPAECYYGLALNQLGMNDLEGAQQSLRIVPPRRAGRLAFQRSAAAERRAGRLRRAEPSRQPEGLSSPCAWRIAPARALREGDLAGARRMFERSLSLSPEQYEMRALYAMTRLFEGDSAAGAGGKRRARRRVSRLSARALCVASQVFWALDREGRGARGLLRRAIELRPDERGSAPAALFAQRGANARGWPRSAPGWRCRRLRSTASCCTSAATALYRTGRARRAGRAVLAAHSAHRPRRDEVARFYCDACARGALAQNAPEYAYQVPRSEHERRQEWIAATAANGGLNGVRAEWKANAEFRRAIRWAASTDDGPLSAWRFLIIARDGRR